MTRPTGEIAAPRRGWAPAVSLAAALLLLLSLSLQQVWNVDYGVLLRIGQFVWQNRAVPAHDVISYTVTDHQWIELRWLFCLLVYGAWNLGGAALTVVAAAVMLITTYALLLWPSRRALVAWPAVVALGIAILGAAGRYVVRPELATYLLTAVFLFVLDQPRLRRGRWLWLLPLLQVVWVNSHTVFIFGPLIAWTYAGAAFLKTVLPLPRRAHEAVSRSFGEALRLAAAALAVTAACWVNPYGQRGALLPILLAREIGAGSFLGRWIDEFRSPFSGGVWSWDLRAAALLAVLNLAGFLANYRRLSVARLALCAGLTYLGGLAVRNVALFVLVSIWALLRNVAEMLEARSSAGRGAPMPLPAAPCRPNALGHVAVGLLLTAGAWYVATDRYAIGLGSPRRFGLGMDERNYAKAAVDFLIAEKAEGPVFHSMPDGSYMAWAGAGRYPVHVDGRLEVYGEAFLRNWIRGSNQEWEPYFAKWGINVAMLQREHFGTLIEGLRRSPQWVLVYVDHRELILVRDIPQHTDLIRRCRIDPSQPWQPRAPEPDAPPAGWRRAIGAIERPWYALGLAETWLLLGSPENAAAAVQRGLERFPRDRELGLLLAGLDYGLERGADAARLMADLGPTPVEAAGARHLAARVLAGRGNADAAIAALEESVRLAPDAGAYGALARLLAGAGRVIRARECYEQATRLSPRQVEHWVGLGMCCEQAADPDGAVRAYTEALRIDGSRAEIHNQLGILYAKRGDAAAARRCFERALAVKPDYASARANLQRVSQMNP
ncbi:Tetratricopeptide repeat protein [Phycisphaerae bacterium RAS1]|nr:Tetratricopeptide repeat protein [Phycisphaerae bacterium RAS1]